MPGKTYTFFGGEWVEGNPMIVGPMTHSMWLGSSVFDGARAFEGVSPDLDLHCERLVRSARALGLNPTLSAGEILYLCQEGVAKFSKDAELYIRPMFYAESGWVDPDPDSTQFVLAVYESPIPDIQGTSACLSTLRRPSEEVAPTAAKASCLYPQSGLAIQEAKRRGFANAVMLDSLGNVAEMATANVMAVKDGEVFTPAPNGTFLNGITRQRIIKLLQADGVTVHETRVKPKDLDEADEIFSTGNYGKVLAINKYENRNLQPGPITRRARELYWDWSKSNG